MPRFWFFSKLLILLAARWRPEVLRVARHLRTNDPGGVGRVSPLSLTGRCAIRRSLWRIIRFIAFKGGKDINHWFCVLRTPAVAVAGGIMFPGCPSIRPLMKRTPFPIWQGRPLGLRNGLIRVRCPKVKGHRDSQNTISGRNTSFRTLVMTKTHLIPVI